MTPDDRRLLGAFLALVVFTVICVAASKASAARPTVCILRAEQGCVIAPFEYVVPLRGHRHRRHRHR